MRHISAESPRKSYVRLPIFEEVFARVPLFTDSVVDLTLTLSSEERVRPHPLLTGQGTYSPSPHRGGLGWGHLLPLVGEGRGHREAPSGKCVAASKDREHAESQGHLPLRSRRTKSTFSINALSALPFTTNLLTGGSAVSASI